MAEFDISKEIDELNNSQSSFGVKSNSVNQTFHVAPTDVMTGGNNVNRYLIYQLRTSISTAERIDIIVSFLMESGVKLLLNDLRSALDRGAKVRILTGNYLGITQPSALYLIKHELKDQVELRFFNSKDISFHPKSYIFHYKNHSEIYIGSSNISRSALTSGIEWNYRFSSINDGENYKKFYDTFVDLYENHSIIIDDEELKRYSKSWHRPAVSKDLERYDEGSSDSLGGLNGDLTNTPFGNADTNVRMIYEPRGAQIEALCALEQSRGEGATKALVQAATGVGKTYLAAFDSKNYEKVLFVAHREEILNQAAVSFKNVRNSEDYGFFNGDNKCKDKPVIFASVATLGRSEYLNDTYFAPDYFDYIVIDEFHHAVNNQYRKIVEYFRPKFLLGLTATPERMDGRDIYEICDYNVPYEISLFDAINKGVLVPFHYYGIYDDTDYSALHLVRGRYDEKELNETYIGNVRRHDLIFKNYRKYRSKSALGFCCSRVHAEEMAREFTRRGVAAVAVYSNANGEYSEDREVAIEKLKTGEINVIFSVDMFNEGVDITNVDMVMFLRPTESPIVFLQQLGRGLRKCKGKQYLNVLDFIGNYEKAGKTRYLLRGNSRNVNDGLEPDGIRTGGSGNGTINTGDYPDDCLVDFDLELIDLFAEMEKKQTKLRDLIKKEYVRVKDYIGHRPSRLELFTYMDDEVYSRAIANSKENPFKRYIDFLNAMDELTTDEQKLYDSVGREFINLLETTNMSKVYKMPVLMAFCDDSQVKMSVSEDELLKAWKKFFGNGVNWKDLDSELTYDKFLKISDKEHIKKIKSMPVHFLLESGKGFFVEKEGAVIAISEQLTDVVQELGFVAQMKDVIEYRVMDYYRRRYRGE